MEIFHGDYEEAPGPHPWPAHREDSSALAEHLVPGDLEVRLHRLDNISNPSIGLLLDRAWTHNEYALATPSTDTDNEHFELARMDLLSITTMRLPARSQIRLNAAMLLAYEETFRARASQEDVTDPMKVTLQAELAQLMSEFINEDEKPLEPHEWGQIAELIGLTYLLNTELFPYLASRREEGNIVTNDNHDCYTLHPCAKNRFKKAPVSIKYNMGPEYEGLVTLRIGNLAMETLSQIPPFNEEDFKAMPEHIARKKATRLAADIMIVTALGETPSTEEQAFMWMLSAKLKDPLVRFASLPSGNDYGSNAEALRYTIAARTL